MRIARVIGALALAGCLASCTAQPDANAVACHAWASANNGWVATEDSTAASSAAVAAARSGLHSALSSASTRATGSVRETMSRAVEKIPENALHVIEPGSPYAAAYDAQSLLVQKACTRAGQPIELRHPPALH
jgi:hypothetical protein